MDNIYSNTNIQERKRGQHLKAEERGAIQSLKKLGYSNRKIAYLLNCSPSTIGYELKRGTAEYKGKGRKPVYNAKRGYAVYKSNRKKCHRHQKYSADTAFMRWLSEQLHKHKWSFDSCVGYAKKHKLFPVVEIPNTKTLYNMLWANKMPVNLFDMPEVLGRKQHKKVREHKRISGKSINLRPTAIQNRNEFGHWESDTVIGKKSKNDAAVFTMVERLTGYYLSIKISGKNTCGVAEAIQQLQKEYGTQFNKVFKTITTDNGSEFAEFSKTESLGTDIYFAHPYSAWERPVNERTNRILRRFLPKGKPISDYSTDYVLMCSDEINALPRKYLNYSTPEELF